MFVRSLGNDGVEVDKIFSKFGNVSELFCPIVVSETFKVNIEPSFSFARSINSSKNVNILRRKLQDECYLSRHHYNPH